MTAAQVAAASEVIGLTPAAMPAQRLLVLAIRTAGRLRYTVERPENYARSTRDAINHTMRRHGPHGLLRVQLVDGNEVDIVIKTITDVELGPLPETVRAGMLAAGLQVHQVLTPPTAAQLSDTVLSVTR